MTPDDNEALFRNIWPVVAPSLRGSREVFDQWASMRPAIKAQFAGDEADYQWIKAGKRLAREAQ